MRISDWSSDVCSSDLPSRGRIRSRYTRKPLGRAGQLRRNPRLIGQPFAHRPGCATRVRQVDREYLALPARIRGDERGVDRGVFAGDQSLRNAAPDRVLEQQKAPPGNAEAATPVIAEGRMRREGCT